MKSIILNLILLFVFLLPAPGCKDRRSGSHGDDGGLSGKLIIFHAGSLAVPFKEIITRFTEEHPNVKVFREVAGSRTCARKVSDLDMPCDILGSADYTVIEDLLIPEHTEWVIRFARNEMALVYGQHSNLTESINEQNWYKILARDDVTFGRSDKNSDPCGYRAVLAIRLAEKHYGLPGLAERLLAKDRKYIRPKETDLIALLEVGEVDYIFLYRSVAEQHHLPYLSLPDEINLSNPAMADFYATASVKLSGKTPRSFIIKKGKPMVYGVTIPNNAPNAPAAVAFLEFLMSEQKGMKIMRKNGQGVIIPALTDTLDKVPPTLREYVKEVK